MKKLLLSMAIAALPILGLTGCIRMQSTREIRISPASTVTVVSSPPTTTTQAHAAP